jgi:hypothetical protein
MSNTDRMPHTLELQLLRLAKITVVNNIVYMTTMINGHIPDLNMMMDTFTVEELRAIQDRLIPHYNTANLAKGKGSV